MTDKVVDASAIAAMVFLEPKAAEIDLRLNGCRLLAPRLLPFGMMSVCQKKIRLHPQKRDNLLSALLNFRIAAIDLRDVNMQGVLNTAERFGLSAYDAGYLWLAECLGVELVTLDVRLKKAAAKLR